MPSDKHSSASFRGAAVRRFLDGEVLAAGSPECGTSALYLFGYAVEMALKAALLRLRGHGDTDGVPLGELYDIVTVARDQYGVPWPPKKTNLHNVALLGQSVVAFRGHLPGGAYPNPLFADDVRRRSEQMGRLWSETLRYHDGVSGPAAVTAGYDSACWFVDAIHEL